MASKFRANPIYIQKQICLHAICDLEFVFKTNAQLGLGCRGYSKFLQIGPAHLEAFTLGYLLVQCWTCDRSIGSSNPRWSGESIFFSRALNADSYSVSIPLQWHIKVPGHFDKSADGRLHLNTHTPLTQWSQSGLTMLLSRHRVGTYMDTNSHATCQRTLGHSHLSSLSYCGLILA